MFFRACPDAYRWEPYVENRIKICYDKFCLE